MRPRRRTRALLALAALLGTVLGVVAWLLRPGAAPGPVDGLGGRTGPVEPVSLGAGAPPTVPPADAPAPSRGPVLEGAAAAGEAAPRDWRLVFEDASGRPLPGLHVTRRPSGSILLPLMNNDLSEEAAVCDADGVLQVQARREDLTPETLLLWTNDPLLLLFDLRDAEQEGIPVENLYRASPLVRSVQDLPGQADTLRARIDRLLAVRVRTLELARPAVAGTAPGHVFPRLRFDDGGVPHVVLRAGAWGEVVAASYGGAREQARSVHRFRLHPEAQRLDVVQALRPRTAVRVEVPPEALPLPPASALDLVLRAGEAVVASGEARRLPDGALLFERVPWFRGEPVSVSGRVGEQRDLVGTGVLGATPDDPVVVHLRRAGEDDTPLSDHNETDLDLREAPGVGHVRLRVVAPSGGPAAGAVVGGEGVEPATTDAEGWVRLDLPPGRPTPLVVLGPGAPAAVTLTAAQERATEGRVQLVRGARLEVEVRDHDDVPLACARLALFHEGGLPWIDVADGVQRLDDLTDLAGRRTLERLAPGTWTVRAIYGSRSVEAPVALPDGEGSALVLRLPAAAAR